MKKVTLILLTVILLTGCNNVLDKKISKETFIDDMRQIEAKDSSKYSQKDFETLVGGIGMSTLSGLGQAWNGTYREALDDIKAKRLKAEADSIQKEAKYERDYNEFNTKTLAMRQYINLKVTSKQMEDIDEMGLAQRFHFSYIAVNNSDEIISSFTGNIAVFGADKFSLGNLPVTNNNPLDPGNAVGLDDLFSYSDTEAGQVKIKDAEFSDLRFEWQPTKLVFKSGRTMTAPPEPPNPGADQ